MLCLTFAACRLLVVGCCLVLAVHCLLCVMLVRVVCCVSAVLRCLPRAVYSSLFVVVWLLFVERRVVWCVLLKFVLFACCHS